jgi:signal transduction histidine kinase
MGFESATVARIHPDVTHLDPIQTAKHEILNALTPVVAYAIELNKTEDNPKRKQQLMAIQRCGITIERLVRNMSSSQKLLEPNFKVVQVSQLLHEAREEALPSASGKNLNLQVLVDEEKDTTVYADPELIRRLVVNLTMNAINASSSDETVILSTCSVKGGVRLAVRDFGPGLPACDLDSLPEGYSTSQGKGHGTGLAVCRAIALMHGGVLGSKNFDRGAEVFFTLPRFVKQPDDSLSSKHPKLLVVDDDMMVVNARGRLLSDRCHVDMANDRNNALEQTLFGNKTERVRPKIKFHGFLEPVCSLAA